MLKRSLICAVVVGALFTMVGCRNEVRRETKVDKAVVKEIVYRQSYTTTMVVPTGKSMMVIPQIHPESFEVKIDYKGVIYNSYRKDLYNYIKKNNKLYKDVDCKMETTYYNDATSSTRITTVDNLQF